VTKSWHKIALASLACMATSMAVPGHAMTLEEAVRLAIETNPQVSAATSNRDAVSDQLRQARSGYLPQLSVSAEAGPARIEDQTTRATPGDDHEDNLRESYRATVTQTLFDGFETGSRVERQQARLRAAAYGVYDTSELLALDTVRQYLEVQRQRRLLEIAQDNVEIHREILNQVQDRLDRGAGSSADVSQTRARLFQAQNTVEQRKQNLRDAIASFQRFVGRAPGDLEDPSLSMESLPANERQALDVAVKQNPRVKRRQAQVEAAQSRIGVEASDYFPEVSLEGESIYRDGVDAADTYEREHRLLLQFEWNLYSGGRDTAERNEAIERASEARSQRMETMRQIREELRRTWSALRGTRNRVRELEQVVEANRETLSAYRQQFNVGQRTLLDVLDAESELFTARTQLTSTRTDQLFARYNVAALTGELLAKIGVQHVAASEPSVPSFTETLIPESPDRDSPDEDQDGSMN
jgi:adhesin transport system outer membrane protein